MNSKTPNVLILSIFALVLTIIAVGAVTSSVFDVSDLNAPTSVVETAGSFTFTFDVNYTGSSENATISFADSTISDGSLDIPSVTDLNGTLTGGDTRTVTGTVSGFSNLGGQTLDVVINATVEGTSARDDETTFSVAITEPPILTRTAICENDNGVSGNDGELEVNIRDITVVDGFGDDEEWLLFDEVEVEVKVENNGDYDVDDISVEWAIANDDLTDFAVDWDEIDEVNIKDGDDDTLTVTFVVDDDDLDFDLDELSGLDYNLVVRATGVIDDKDDLFADDDTCAADFNEISIQDESDFVILTNIDVPDQLSCGESATITADVWNIGDRTQDEVSVDVYDKNKELINQIFDVGDIDEFDNTDLSFIIDVPEDAEEGTYTLFLRVLDEDGDLYENDYDEDPAEFFAPLVVEGECSSASDVTVSASIVSGGQAGKSTTVSALIKNNANSQRTYTVSAVGYESWASSADVDPGFVVLNSGESKEVDLTFDVKDVSGSQSFFIQLSSDGEIVRQPVSLEIQPSKGFLTGSVISGDNWYLWGIGLLNLVLIIVIVIVAIRVARR